MELGKVIYEEAAKGGAGADGGPEAGGEDSGSGDSAEGDDVIDAEYKVKDDQ